VKEIDGDSRNRGIEVQTVETNEQETITAQGVTLVRRHLAMDQPMMIFKTGSSTPQNKNNSAEMGTLKKMK